MENSIFKDDFVTTKQAIIYERKPVSDFAAKIEADKALCDCDKAIAFSNEVNSRKVADFEKDGIDQMCHVSTFVCADATIFMSYYANTENPEENPDFQVARLAYAPIDNPTDKTILDIQGAGEYLDGLRVNKVYDTILMQREDNPQTIYILWTADVGGNYYRLYRTFDIKTKTLGKTYPNRFKVGDIVNDFSSSGMQNALSENGIGYKEFFSDIGIMQKLSTRVENGETYYYTGTYSGNFTCIIKSRDLIEWEYVAQPNEGANGTGFENETKWENAVYVLDNKVYYFVRQWDPEYDEDKKLTAGSPYGILTTYDLDTKEWAKPVLVGDCQSRSDFIVYNDCLYLFYAPTDREHIGILKINTDDISKTEVVLQANMNGSCFYPFVQYFGNDGELAISYTVSRKHIRLARFTLSEYI